MAAGRKTGGGSRKGVPNKATAALKEMILTALSDAGGVKYLMRQANESPTAFLSLIGRVLPLTLAGDPDEPIKHAVSVIHRVIVDPKAAD